MAKARGSRGYWVRSKAKIEKLATCTGRIVIPDVRFENEAALVRGMGGVVVHVSGRAASTVGATSAHVSELGVKAETGDFFLRNDSTIEALHAKVDALVSSVG